MASHWLIGLFATATLASGAAVPATAQEELTLEAGKVWTHEHSGIAIPPTLGGTPRTRGMAYAADDLDVSLGFAIDRAVESLSIYIFRDTNGAVPVWFSQAQWGIENRDIYDNPAISLAPQAFAPPGQATASGLKAVYEPQSGPYRSTGLMLLPVGQWYVKLRASSQSRSPAELASWMDKALAGIIWPQAQAAAPAATPVTACPAPLSFSGKAKDAPKDGRADLASDLPGMTMGQGDAKPTPESIASQANARWCRDSTAGGNRAVYRRDADTDRYLLAVGDNGNGIWVGPDAGAAVLAEKKAGTAAEPRFSITLMMAGQNITYVAQDRLPSPQRVIEIFEANRRVTTVPTWDKGKSVAIDSNGF